MSNLNDVSLFGSGSVFRAGVLVSMEFDLNLARYSQIDPHVLADGHDLVFLLCIPGPNGEFVTLRTNVDDGAADLGQMRYIALLL